MLRDITPLIAALGGLLVGALGVYLNFKSRAAPLRDRLYAAQLSLLSEAVTLSYECYLACANCSRLANNAELIAQIRKDRGPDVTALQKLSFRASALLPSTTAEALYDFVGAINQFLVPADTSAPIPAESIYRE